MLARTIKSRISVSFAANSLVILFSLTVVFHLLAITGIIPADILWGGGSKDAAQMLKLEIISLVLNLVMLFFAVVKAGYLNLHLSTKLIRTVFWVMFFLFLLNTLGNIFAVSNYERFLFTPVTLLLAVMCYRLATDRE